MQLRKCPIHKTPLVCPSCMSAKGGSVSSEAKRRAALEREAAKRALRATDRSTPKGENR